VTVFVQRTDGKLDYTFDWADDVSDPITLESVTHIVPGGMTLDSETTDTVGLSSTVFITGGEHGGTYLIKALALLSNGALVPGEATIRVFDA
jgi:hypothetical protein